MLKDKFWSSQSRDLFNSTPLVLFGVSCPSFWLERVPNFIKILNFIKNQELFHLPFMNGYSETGGLGTVRGLFLWDAPSPQLIDCLLSVVAAGRRAVPAHPRSCSSVFLPQSPTTPLLALSQSLGTTPPAFGVRRLLPKHPSTPWAELWHFRMSC